MYYFVLCTTKWQKTSIDISFPHPEKVECWTESKGDHHVGEQSPGLKVRVHSQEHQRYEHLRIICAGPFDYVILFTAIVSESQMNMLYLNVTAFLFFFLRSACNPLAVLSPGVTLSINLNSQYICVKFVIYYHPVSVEIYPGVADGDDDDRTVEHQPLHPPQRRCQGEVVDRSRELWSIEILI